MSEELKALVAQFEREVRFDCHSVELAVERSEAGKQLLAKAREALPAVAAYLEALPEPGENQLESGIQAGIAMLMADLGHVLNLDVPKKMRFGDRSGWIGWAKVAPV